MSLDTSYEVLEMLRDDGVQTFRAKEKATGRGLEIHLLPPFGRPENKTLFEKLKTLPLEARRRFLDIGFDGSTPYLVTDPLPGNRGFKGWAEELIAGTQAPPSVFNPGMPNAAPSRDDGVQILQAGQWRTGTPIPDSLVSKPPSKATFIPPSAPPPPVAPADTGDFTRMFQAPSFLTGPPQPASTPPSPPSPSPAPPPSEFTGFFRAAEPSKGSALDITQDVTPAMGEFTGLFEAKKLTPVAPTPPPPASFGVPIVPPSTPTPAPPAFAPPASGGEFTRMFQAPSAGPSFPPQPASPPIAKPEPSGATEFTKYFENPLRPAPMSSQPQSQPTFKLPPPPPPPAAKRGGDFTEVFGRPASPAPGGSPGGFSYDSPSPQPPPPSGPVFGAMPSATGAFSAQPSWSQPQAQPTFPSGPSEYTKMMNVPATPMGGPSVFSAPPNAAPAPPMATKKSNAPLFIAIGVVIVLLLGIVVFLLMQHSGASPATIPAAK
jgi:hypothetical protein